MNQQCNIRMARIPFSKKAPSDDYTGSPVFACIDAELKCIGVVDSTIHEDDIMYASCYVVSAYASHVDESNLEIQFRAPISIEGFMDTCIICLAVVETTESL